MGSPNFYTDTDGLNVAIDTSFFPDYDYEDPCEVVNDILCEKSKEMESFVNSLPTLFWHEVVFQMGYHEGFQVYIQGNWENKDKFTEEIVNDWKSCKSLTTANGYEVDLDNCPYFKSNAVNITYFSLDRAIDKEYKTLHEAIAQKAIELGLGEVVGRTWCSSVQYPINTRKI